MTSERLTEREPLRPNEAQEAKLRKLCDGYKVEYAAEHYLVYPPDSFMMPGWAEGWLGNDISTLYVGVSPEGEAHS